MKKKILKFVMTCCLLITCLTFFACDFGNNNPNNNSDSTGDVNVGQNEIADVTPTYTSISEATTAKTNAITNEQKDTELPSVYNTNVYAISTAGDYYFSGSLTDSITVAKNSGAVHIYLNNASLSVSATNAISSKKGAYVVITLIGNNTLSNTDDAKHIIDSKEDLVINGSGNLTINSTKSAIACDKTFIGLGGTLNITAEKHGITADSIYIDGATINATSCKGDILHAESDYDEVETAPEFSFGAGYIYIISGTINSTFVLGDGIQADSFVYIKSGTFNLITTPTWNDSYVATQDKETGMYRKIGSSYQKVAKESVYAGSTYSVLEESVKGIKVGEIDYCLATDTETELTVSSTNYTILIEGGTFNINTIDDSIHTNSGSVLIYGGNITINTSDDGIHADKNLKIAGNSTINIMNSYEGLEGETIDISGGDTTIYALDDGVNAASGNLDENQQKSVCQLNISGGRLDVTVDQNGDKDGIDSNGGIKITGGVVITRGPDEQNASPLDATNAISVTGGIVIIVGHAPESSEENNPSHDPNRRGGSGIPSGTTFNTTLKMTQDSSNSLLAGTHTVTVAGTTISYTNARAYSGYTTVYASATATIN